MNQYLLTAYADGDVHTGIGPAIDIGEAIKTLLEPFMKAHDLGHPERDYVERSIMPNPTDVSERYAGVQLISELEDVVNVAIVNMVYVTMLEPVHHELPGARYTEGPD